MAVRQAPDPAAASAPEILRLAAFSRDPAGGNPAGVALCRTHPPDDEMQRLAAAVGLSETVFLAPLDEAGDGTPRWRGRYFAPASEVDFCGHATIAAGVLLGRRRNLSRLYLETNHATVPVRVGRGEDGVWRATLRSPAASVAPLSPEVVDHALTLLRWTRDDLDPDLPPAHAHAGAGHLLLFLRERYLLGDLRYDHEGLAALCREQGWLTVACLWRRDDRRFHARNAAPAVGIEEDPATGSAAAALGGYLRDRGIMEPPWRLTIRQGEDMGRPGTIRVRIPEDDPGIDVGGTAVVLPPAGGDG